MRRNAIILVFVLVLVTVLAYVVVYRPQSTKINEATVAADQAKDRVQELELELARRQELKKNAAKLQARFVQLEAALPTGDPRLSKVINDLNKNAELAGITWQSVSPSLPVALADNPAVFEVNITVQITGGYFQVQDYLVRIENLSRAMKVLTTSLSPAELPDLNTSLTMKMFVDVPVVPAPQGTTPATPST